MNSSQPEADIEYSTRPGGPNRHDRPSAHARKHPHRQAGRGGRPAARRAALGARLLAWTGAALLAAAEFCPLLHVRTIAVHPHVVHTVRSGPHHGWALVVIAALAALLSMVSGRPGGRPAAAMVALLGAGALSITFGIDVPDAHAAGLVTIAGGTPLEAQAHAAIGLYLETLGAVALLLSGGLAATLGRRPANPAGENETRGLPTARDRGLR